MCKFHGWFLKQMQVGEIIPFSKNPTTYIDPLRASLLASYAVVSSAIIAYNMLQLLQSFQRVDYRLLPVSYTHLTLPTILRV